MFVTFLGLQASLIGCRQKRHAPERQQDGNPRKLYLPRDYSGSYCDADSNWGTDYNLSLGRGFSVMATPCKLALASPRQGFPFLSYTMNVTWLGTTGQPQFAVGAWQLPRSTTDLVVKELLLD